MTSISRFDEKTSQQYKLITANCYSIYNNYFLSNIVFYLFSFNVYHKVYIGFFQHPVEKQITIFLVIIILEDVCTFTNTGGHAS